MTWLYISKARRVSLRRTIARGQHGLPRLEVRAEHGNDALTQLGPGGLGKLGDRHEIGSQKHAPNPSEREEPGRQWGALRGLCRVVKLRAAQRRDLPPGIQLHCVGIGRVLGDENDALRLDQRDSPCSAVTG